VADEITLEQDVDEILGTVESADAGAPEDDETLQASVAEPKEEEEQDSDDAGDDEDDED
jgi:hypothetical protein